MAEKIGIYFGSSTGATERAAILIKSEIDSYTIADVEVQVVSMNNLNTMSNYKYLLFGCPTWNIGELQDDWAIVFPSLNNINFEGRKVGVFGCGDQYGYSNTFNDAIGMLSQKIIDLGGEPCGWMPRDESYQFEFSRGVYDDVLMGLFLDEDNQAAQTPQRVANWVNWLLEDFGLRQPAAA